MTGEEIRLKALEYAEKVKKVNKGVIDAFEAGYKQKEKEYSKLDYTYHLSKAKQLLSEQLENNRKEIDNIKLGIGYADLRGSAYEREMNKINSILEENKIIQVNINNIKTFPL